jgi:hypothetical protein
MVVSSQFRAPAALPPGKKSPGAHCVGGWVGPRAVLEFREKRKFLAPVGNITPPVQPVARRYTD